MNQSTPSKRKLSPSALFLLALYLFATLQFLRFYCADTTPQVELAKYFAGQERMPFQKRLLPILFLEPVQHALQSLSVLGNHQKAFSPDRAPILLLGLLSLAIAGVFTQLLYRRVSPHRRLDFLVYPALLAAISWSYTLHVEANYLYPYDLLSVAIFSAGLYFIYTGRFFSLFLTVLVGTFNRESTLFLIAIFVLDALVRDTPPQKRKLQLRQALRKVPWTRAAVLFLLWAGIEVLLNRHFSANSRMDEINRIPENLPRLAPQFWPVLLNIGGYLLPLVFVLRNDLPSQRFRSYLWIFVLWFPVMFYSAVITETRVFGELCPYLAVALVLIIEAKSQPVLSVQ